MVNKIGRITAFICALILALTACSTNEEGIVMRVGSEKVETDEFMLIAKRHKAEAVKYFADNYGAEYSKGFWETDFEGMTPRQYLCELAVTQLKEDKMLQKLAKKEGIMESNSYSDLIDTMNKNNEERKKQKENGEVVYGVTEYTPHEYYNDSMAKLRISIKNQLAERLKPNEKILKGYYEEIKEVYYKLSPEAKLTLYEFPSEKESVATAYMEKSLAGENIDKGVTADGGEIHEMETNYETDRHLTLYYPGILDSIRAGKINTVCGPYMTGGKVSFIRINEVKDGGYKSFDEIESNVLSMYLDKYVNDEIEKAVKKAKIVYTNEYDELDFSEL